MQFQFELARQKGLAIPEGDRLIEKLNQFFEEQPKASLLHGDLWSGNVGFLSKDLPLIFDPATHYGDPECDLAMTEMFGGFPPEFYRGYHEVLPQKNGHEKRRDLYQLYHVLNHFNLFGGGYGRQSQQMVMNLLK